MLKKFTLANFKSYREATLELAPLTLLIGANASGKSNAIEALQVLSWLARGRRLEDIFRAVEESELMIRGTVPDLTCEAVGAFRLGCSLQHKSAWSELDVEIAVGPVGMRILEEEIRSPEERSPLYRVENATTGFPHAVIVSYNNFALGGIEPRIVCTDEQAIFTQLLTPARFAAQHEKSQQVIPEVARSFMAALVQILSLDPMPRRMRGYSFVVDKVLKGDCSNVSSTLHDLCLTPEGKQRVLDFIRDLPEQDITDVDFLKGPRNEVMVKLEETFGGKRQFREAAVLSDGTLRVLAVAAALLSAQSGSTVVVEEIDNGIHPSRARKLLANIEAVAKRQGLSVLLTSHNPALLDALPFSAIPNVVFCYRDPQMGDSRLIRLESLNDYPELVAQGPLGRLVTQSIVDRMVKSQSTPEQMEQANLDWIERLERATDAQ